MGEKSIDLNQFNLNDEDPEDNISNNIPEVNFQGSSVQPGGISNLETNLTGTSGQPSGTIIQPTGTPIQQESEVETPVQPGGTIVQQGGTIFQPSGNSIQQEGNVVNTEPNRQAATTEQQAAASPAGVEKQDNVQSNLEMS